MNISSRNYALRSSMARAALTSLYMLSKRSLKFTGTIIRYIGAAFSGLTSVWAFRWARQKASTRLLKVSGQIDHDRTLDF